MKFNRRMTAALGATLLMAALVGCDNNKDEVKTFNNTINGVDLTYIYHYKGDVVTRQDAENTIPYQSLGVSNEEQARKVIDPIGAAYSKSKALPTASTIKRTSRRNTSPSTLIRLKSASCVTCRGPVFPTVHKSSFR